MMKSSDRHRLRISAIFSIFTVFMLVSTLFVFFAENAKAYNNFSCTVRIPNNGYRGQTITVDYGYGKVSSYSWDDEATVILKFSIAENLVTESWLYSLVASAKDGTSSGVVSVSGVGLGTPTFEMGELGLSMAYFNVYAENRLGEPVTISIERIYGTSLGTFSVPADADGYKLLGQATEDDLAARDPRHFTASWGPIVYDRYTLPFTIDWGAGVGGPGDSLYKKMGVAGGKFIIGAYPPEVSGKVSPSSGDINTQFQFNATWTAKDTNTDATVTSMDLYIDGTKYTMNSAGGNSFTYATELSTGTHEYYYSAKWWHNENKVDSAMQSIVVTQAPEPKIELFPSEQFGECYAGRSTSYQVIAKNNGDASGTANLSASSSGGWTVWLTDNNSALISNITLNPRESRVFNVNMTAPLSPQSTVGQSDKTSVTATVTGKTSSSVSITTLVQELPGISLIVTDSREKVVDNGQDEYFSMIVQNEYDQANNITFSSSSPWLTSIVDLNRTVIVSNATLEVGESRNFYVMVTAPKLTVGDENTYGGAAASINVTVQSTTLGKQASASVKAVIKTVSDISFFVVNPTSGELSGRVGNDIYYTLMVANNGNVPDVFDAMRAVSQNSTWKIKLQKDMDGAYFTDTNRNMVGADTGQIPVGANTSIFVKITLSRDAKDTQNTTFLVTGKSAISGVEKNITLTAIAVTPGIELLPGTMEGFCKPGQSTSYYITINNMQQISDKMMIRTDSSVASKVDFYDIAENYLQKDVLGAPYIYSSSNSQESIQVKINVPETAAAASNDVTKVTAESSTSQKSSSTSINTTILPVVGISFLIKNKTQEGVKTNYTINITNQGNAQDTINIRYNSNSMVGWSTELLFENGTPLSDTNADGFVDIGPVAPKESKTVKVSITRPQRVQAGATEVIAVNATTSWTLPKYLSQFPNLNKNGRGLNETINATIREGGSATIVIDDTVGADVSVSSKDIYVTCEGKITSSVFNNTAIKITAIIKNIGKTDLNVSEGFSVNLYVKNGTNVVSVLGNLTNDDLIGSAPVYSLAANSSINVYLNYFLSESSLNATNIFVIANAPYEVNISNNVGQIPITIIYRDLAKSDVSTTDYTKAIILFCVVVIGLCGVAMGVYFRRRELL